MPAKSSFTSDPSEGGGARCWFVSTTWNTVGFYRNVLQKARGARKASNHNSNLGVTPATSDIYKKKRFILMYYSLLRKINIHNRKSGVTGEERALR